MAVVNRFLVEGSLKRMLSGGPVCEVPGVLHTPPNVRVLLEAVLLAENAYARVLTAGTLLDAERLRVRA